MKCPTCGMEMKLDEKDTSSGRDMRTYRCNDCKKDHIEDFGPALWQVLHDGREADKQASPPPDPAARPPRKE